MGWQQRQKNLSWAKFSFRERREQASTLLLVLASLFLLSFLGVSFVRISILEAEIAQNYEGQFVVELVSEAGIEFAVANLREDFQDKLLTGLRSPEEKIPDEWLPLAENDPYDQQEDLVGAGVAIKDMGKWRPSYAMSKNGEILSLLIEKEKKYISGMVNQDPQKIFTLKILDVNSQLNLNSQLSVTDEDLKLPLATMLNHLSQAIAVREPYLSMEEDPYGPLFDQDKNEFLGEKIVQKRQELGRFLSKWDLLRVEGITRKKLNYIFDYVTTHAPLQNVIARCERQAKSGVKEPYRPDLRSPVNINTASWPVLVALFWGLEYQDEDNPFFKVLITKEDAFRLASKICEDRLKEDHSLLFHSWEDFKHYLLLLADQTGPQEIFSSQKSDVTPQQQSQTRRDKAYIVYANADSNVSLRRLNPDLPAWQPINQTDLTFYTTEFCFYPHGIFEITSLGQYLDKFGKVTHEAIGCSVVKIFDLIQKTSQYDFQLTQKVANPNNPALSLSEKASLHAFSHVNNLQKNISSGDSRHFGYIQPVIYDYRYGVPEIDFTEEQNPQGKLMFKANFNGQLRAEEGREKDLFLPKPKKDFFGQTVVLSKKKSASPVAPNISPEEKDIVPFGSLAPDGVLFEENPDFARADPSFEKPENSTLCYQSNGNMPGASSFFSEGDENEGTLLFWFKLNENKDWSKWRTVFFSTSPLPGFSDKGIQMEVQMRYEKQTGVFEIQARRQYYDKSLQNLLSGSDLLNSTPPNIAFLRYGVRYKYGTQYLFDQSSRGVIKPHEWYHVAVRWQNGTDMEFSSIADAIILHGNFYSSPSSQEPSFFSAMLREQGGVVEDFELTDLVDGSFLGNLINLPNLNFTGEVSLGEFLELKADDFAPMEESEVGDDGGLFYIGAVHRGNTVHSSAMTIDDIRIVKSASAVSDPAYNPFRYIPYNRKLNPAPICLYRGNLSLPSSEEIILGQMVWTTRKPFLEDKNIEMTFLSKISHRRDGDFIPAEITNIPSKITNILFQAEETFFPVEKDLSSLLVNSFEKSLGSLENENFTSLPVENPKNPALGEEEIEVASSHNNSVEYQVLFYQYQEGTSDSSVNYFISPNYLTPMIDDLAIQYQGSVQYLGKTWER